MNTGSYPKIGLRSARLNLGLDMATAKEIVGANIGRWVESHSEEWNQSRLAEYLSVSPTAVSKWILGKSLPDAEMLDRLAALFQVKVHELFIPDAKLAPQEIDPEQGLRAYLKSQGFIVRRAGKGN